MRHLLKATFFVCLFALSASAQDETPVPVEKAAYHWPVFQNDHVMLLRVYFPPGRGSNYHIHALDQISVVLEGGGNANQVFGKPPTGPREGKGEKSGGVSFTPFSKKQFIHKSTNVGKTPFHNIVVALVQPKPGNFQPQAREALGYTQIFDNERARAWRLRLEPGQSAAAINQTAPGLRIAVTDGVIADIVEGQQERGLALRPGDFYWQDAGQTRGVRNIGDTAVHIVEIELK